MGDICQFLHLPSNVVIAKIYDLDLHFEGKKFNVVVSDTVRAAIKCLEDMCRRKFLIEMHHCDLDLLSEGKIFLIFIYLKRKELSQKCV